MTIALTTNHAKPRWWVNVQENGFRMQLFLRAAKKPSTFAEATGSPVRINGKKSPTIAITATDRAREYLAKLPPAIAGQRV